MVILSVFIVYFVLNLPCDPSDPLPPLAQRNMLMVTKVACVISELETK
jgi:hypothetical protein